MWSLTISGKHCSIKLSWTTPGYLLECVVDVGFPPAALCAGHREYTFSFFPWQLTLWCQFPFVSPFSP